ncbi:MULTISPECIES: CBS domain-containing protein [Thiorhodovibrio]|uniref:CBS domain-containing protein n=1 Tax=Thiorhodovibrio TaxID=61593 RepID=UPI0019136686|nr:MULTISPECIES: CBS domain-containing protein [Thiorhodovibrio]MBK5969137.1 hypothetical protein [Thiorhodovibrio winogradskyi]WPL13390.1 hypothetical protein Thiosp_03191 [Thiorhodovibrio litoralis]
MSVIQTLRSDVTPVAADAPLLDGARCLGQGATALVPVIDGGQLVGMLSARDIVVNAVVAERDLDRLTVADVMSRPHRCEPQTPIDEVAKHLATIDQPGLVVQDPGDASILGVVEMAALLRPPAQQPHGPEPDYAKRVRGAGA